MRGAIFGVSLVCFYLLEVDRLSGLPCCLSPCRFCIDDVELPHSPQACVDRVWLRQLLQFVAVHWAIAAIIVTLVRGGDERQPYLLV